MLFSPQILVGTRKALVAAAATTWDPANKSIDLTLDGTKLIFTGAGSATYNNVKSTTSHSSGKYYWQIVVTTESQALFQGIGNSTASLAGGSSFVGVDTNSLGWGSNGAIQPSSLALASVQTWAQGDTLCFALDLGNSKIWFRNGTGGNWNNDVIGNQNPATNTGGTSIAGMAAGPYFAMGGTVLSGDVYTTNFTTMTFAPSGFGPF